MPTMRSELGTVLAPQLEAAIDMLENAIIACPDAQWTERLWTEGGEPTPYSEFAYLAYHGLFWLDLYLTGSVEGFAPPAPFTLDELDPAGLLPERPYTKAELGAYVDHCRAKLRTTVEGLTEAAATRPCPFPWGTLSFAELLVYNLRHVQEHASQLNLFLGQRLGEAPGWVTGTRRRPGLP